MTSPGNMASSEAGESRPGALVFFALQRSAGLGLNPNRVCAAAEARDCRTLVAVAGGGGSLNLGSQPRDLLRFPGVELRLGMR